MTWNHRIVRKFYKHVHRDDTMLFQIHEVFYNPDGSVMSITEEPTRIMEESVEDLQKTLERLQECLKHPVLDYDTLKEC